jgi:leucyl aminopeptidase
LLKSVCFARDLVNEPHLTAETFAEEVCRLCAGQGVKTEVFNRSRIEALKMNGLLAVNQGSFYDPCFVVLEYKPENARNSKPLFLVGKGVIFDTGGMNLKPGNYMETMKSDMSGAAAVAGALLAVAAAKLPVHVVGLIPATDNRPGPKALVPGDIIRMNNGTTIEVINTDAEGRLILADALLYAKRYDPEVVIDIATLTGAAEMALGKHGMVAMHLNAAGYLEQLKQSGWNTYERLAEFPFWDEYDKEIESDVADIRNLGKAGKAGAITAGKFLSRFVSYPWIHLDIAGVAFNESKESYRNKGGTGVGVRLFFDFLKNDGQL